MRTVTEFKHGHLAKIAEASGITKQRLHNYMAGRRSMPSDIAEKCQIHAASFGYTTSVFDWLFIKESTNPLFDKWK